MLEAREIFSGSKETKLSPEEIGNLIAAIGNHEAKALVLISMNQGNIYSRTPLFRRFIEIQGENVIWCINSGTPLGYCANSLSPIGLVTREVIDPDLETYGYIRTEYGNNFGVALAGQMLSLSEKYPDFSLGQIWGSTMSPARSKKLSTTKGISEFKKRAPFTRLEIFRALLSTDLPIREADLSFLTGESQDILGKNLNDLAAKKLITYERADADTPFALYQLSPNTSGNEKDPVHTDYPQLIKVIYKIFQDNPSVWFSSEQLVDRLLKMRNSKRALKRISLVRHVREITHCLEDDGYLSRQNYSGKRQSAISLTFDQRVLLMDFVGVIDAFCNLDPNYLAEGRYKAAAIISDPKRVSALLKKARETSNSAQLRLLNLEETSNQVFSIIAENPECTTRLIKYLLERNCGISLTPEGIRRYLRALKKDKKIKVTGRGQAIYWQVCE